MEIISTSQVAKLLAVSEATVKRWTDDGVLRCYRTPGGHRKFRATDVQEFMSTHRFANDGGAVVVDDPAAAAPCTRGILAELALAADTNGLVRCLASAIGAGRSVDVLLDEVVAPALRDIGERWACRNVEVGAEHVASTAIGETLARLAPVVEGTAARGVALSGCLENERHDLAARMAALVLRSRGFRVLTPGADTPSADLAHLVAETRAKVVALSSTGVVSLPDAGALAAIAEAAQRVGGRLYVGGAGFERLPELPPGVERLPDLRALVGAVG